MTVFPSPLTPPFVFHCALNRVKTVQKQGSEMNKGREDAGRVEKLPRT